MIAYPRQRVGEKTHLSRDPEVQLWWEISTTGRGKGCVGEKKQKNEMALIDNQNCSIPSNTIFTFLWNPFSTCRQKVYFRNVVSLCRLSHSQTHTDMIPQPYRQRDTQASRHKHTHTDTSIHTGLLRPQFSLEQLSVWTCWDTQQDACVPLTHTHTHTHLIWTSQTGIVSL